MASCLYIACAYAAAQTSPVFVAETHSATDGAGLQFNRSTLTINVSGPNTLLIAAWHAEFDGTLVDSWSVKDNGVAGTEIVDTDGYNGGAGNRRFRIYYWLNPPAGTNTVAVSNPYDGGNELAVSVLLFNNVSQATSLGTPVLGVSTAARTGESETVSTGTSDLVLHVIADALIVTGTLSTGETQVSLANDGHHPPTGDASLLISTKSGAAGNTTVSSSGWASRVINGVGIAIHGASPGQAPAPPSNLAATGGNGLADLNWVASPGPNLAGYSVYRGSAPTVVPSSANRVGQPAAAPFIDNSFTASGNYYYVVTARDPSGNESAPSNETSINVTADISSPTPPSNLTGIAVSNKQITLSWAASVDNVRVVSYSLERCKGTGCTSFKPITSTTRTSFANTGLAAASSYSYRVRATDEVGNLSGYSNVLSVTTLTTPPPPPVPAFVQGNSATPQSSAVSSLGVTYAGAQTAGNMNILIIGWNDNSASVASATDTAGNHYALAVGPTSGAGVSQSIYYAKNIASASAGSNVVIVTFTSPANLPDVRILEYSGIDPVTPVDISVSAARVGILSNSGWVTTVNARDLLLGANTVKTNTTSPGAGYTNRIITADGDIVEDRFITKTSNYRATAPLSSAGAWVMQMVAFRAAP